MLMLIWITTRQGFWYFVRSRSREFQVNQWNPVKFTKRCEILRNSLEILPNTCWHNIFGSYLGCWRCLLAVNLLIYLETSSLQRVTTSQNYQVFLNENPGVPSTHKPWTLGMRVRQRVLTFARSSWRMLPFVKDYAFNIRSSHLQRWRSISEQFGPQMFMPKNLQNEQSSCSFSRDNK